MSVLGTLFKARDKPGRRLSPRNSLNGGAYSFFFGGTTSGKAVNERSAMQMTAVYACVRILSEAVASLPLHVYRYNDAGDPSRAGGKEKALAHPLYKLLHDEPNPEMSAFSFRETLMTHLLLWGNGYAQIIRNGRGEVLSLYPLMPDRMTVDRDAQGSIFYEYARSDGDVRTMGGKSAVRLAPSDVLHIPGLGFDGLVGYSPIAMAKNAIGMGLACDEYGASFYQNGAQPGGVLEHPGVVKDPKRVRESWNAIYQGSANAHRVAVLEEGMAYKPISISPEQAQFLETRKFQIDEIARIFRVPPHMVGDLEKSSFSNIEQQSLEFVKYTLAPWITRWEQAIYRALLSEAEKAAFWQVMRNKSVSHDVYNALRIGQDDHGGFLAPDEFQRTLIDALQDQNIFRQLAHVITTSSGDRKIPVVASKGTAAWIDEEAAYPESDDTFGMTSIGAYKLATMIKVSDELLNDSVFDIASYIATEFARRIGAAEEEAFFTGNGSGKPLGILAATGGSETGVTAASATAITMDEVLDLFYSLRAPYRRNAVFLMNDSTVKALRKLKNGNGDYIWQPSVTAGTPDTILNRPVYTSAFMPSLAAGTKTILFGDLGFYWVADREGRSFQRLNELYAATGQVGFLSSERVDGKLILPEAVKVLQQKAS